MPTFDLICLANSRKHNGRCVAGLRTDGQGWLRPVGLGQGGVLYPPHYTLADRTEAGVLDLLRVDLTEPRPAPHQPENWLIGCARWELLARPAGPQIIDGLRAALVHGPELLGNNLAKVPYAQFEANHAPASLALVYPQATEWRLGTSSRGSRQTRLAFTLAGVLYSLPVTDLGWELRLAHLPLGVHPLTAAGLQTQDRVILTISLSEPLEGYCYKLVAAVIVVPPAWLPPRPAAR